MTITATDKVGNTFPKRVKLKLSDNGTIVSLGGPLQWYLSDIVSAEPPNDNKFLIDIGGRHHMGYPVWVSRKELIAIIHKLKDPNIPYNPDLTSLIETTARELDELAENKAQKLTVASEIDEDLLEEYKDMYYNTYVQTLIEHLEATMSQADI